MLWRMRARPVIVAAIATASAAAVVGAAVAATSKTVHVVDDKDDVSGALDIQRATLKRARDGRLRAVITLASKASPRMLLAGSGPPGSVCLKIWTDPDADPQTTPPDRLVCVTARKRDELRASVFKQSEPGLPERVRSSSVRMSRSGRSIIVLFAQSSLGRPRLIRFAVESTRPGCGRVSCIDEAPKGGAVRRFRTR